jgi:hypothetical protein
MSSWIWRVPHGVVNNACAKTASTLHVQLGIIRGLLGGRKVTLAPIASWSMLVYAHNNALGEMSQRIWRAPYIHEYPSKFPKKGVLHLVTLNPFSPIANWQIALWTCDIREY